VEDGVSNSFAAHVLVLSLAADNGALRQTALHSQQKAQPEFERQKEIRHGQF
jgi:hypothetical protein